MSITFKKYYHFPSHYYSVWHDEVTFHSHWLNILSISILLAVTVNSLIATLYNKEKFSPRLSQKDITLIPSSIEDTQTALDNTSAHQNFMDVVVLAGLW